MLVSLMERLRGPKRPPSRQPAKIQYYVRNKSSLEHVRKSKSSPLPGRSIAAEVEERLESELFEAQERVVQLEGELSEMQATMKVQVEEKNVELEKLREENEFKDLLLARKTSELALSHQRHYELEQELTFCKLDAKFDASRLSEISLLSRSSEVEHEPTGVALTPSHEAPYLGRARYKSNSLARQAYIHSTAPLVSIPQSVPRPIQAEIVESSSPQQARVEEAGHDRAEDTHLQEELSSALTVLKNTLNQLRGLTNAEPPPLGKTDDLSFMAHDLEGQMEQLQRMIQEQEDSNAKLSSEKAQLEKMVSEREDGSHTVGIQTEHVMFSDDEKVIRELQGKLRRAQKQLSHQTEQTESLRKELEAALQCTTTRDDKSTQVEEETAAEQERKKTVELQSLQKAIASLEAELEQHMAQARDNEAILQRLSTLTQALEESTVQHQWVSHHSAAQAVADKIHQLPGLNTAGKVLESLESQLVSVLHGLAVENATLQEKLALAEEEATDQLNTQAVKKSSSASSASWYQTPHMPDDVTEEPRLVLTGEQMGQLRTVFGQLSEKLQESLGVRYLDEQRLESALRNEDPETVQKLLSLIQEVEQLKSLCQEHTSRGRAAVSSAPAHQDRIGVGDHQPRVTSRHRGILDPSSGHNLQTVPKETVPSGDHAYRQSDPGASRTHDVNPFHSSTSPVMTKYGAPNRESTPIQESSPLPGMHHGGRSAEVHQISPIRTTTTAMPQGRSTQSAKQKEQSKGHSTPRLRSTGIARSESASSTHVTFAETPPPRVNSIPSYSSPRTQSESKPIHTQTLTSAGLFCNVPEHQYLESEIGQLRESLDEIRLRARQALQNSQSLQAMIERQGAGIRRLQKRKGRLLEACEGLRKEVEANEQILGLQSAEIMANAAKLVEIREKQPQIGGEWKLRASESHREQEADSDQQPRTERQPQKMKADTRKVVKANDRSRQELSDLQEKLHHHTNKIDESQKRLDVLNKVIKEGEHRKAVLLLQCRELKQHHSLTLEKQKHEMSALEQSLNSKEREVHEQDNVIALRQQHLELMEREKASNESQLSDAATTLETLTSECRDLEGRKASLRHSVDQQQTEYKEVAADIERKRSILTKLQAELEQSKAELKDARAKTKSKLTNYKRRIQEATSEYNELRIKSQDQLSSTTKGLQAMESQWSEAQKRLEDLQSTIGDKEKQLRRQCQKLTQAEEEVQRLQKEERRKQQQLISLNKKIKATAEQVQRGPQDSDSGSLDDSHQKIMDQLQTGNAEMKAEITSLREHRDELPTPTSHHTIPPGTKHHKIMFDAHQVFTGTRLQHLKTSIATLEEKLRGGGALQEGIYKSDADSQMKKLREFQSKLEVTKEECLKLLQQQQQQQQRTPQTEPESN